MGFAAEKKVAEKKWGRFKLVLFILVLCILIAFVVVSLFLPPSTWKYRVAQPNVGKRAEGELRIHFLDVGQGDATLIELPDGKIALVDGGNTTQESECAVMRYLYALDVRTIDYLILTHADSDHCGALDTVLTYFDVKRAYVPLADKSANGAYAAFCVALDKEKNCEVAYAHAGITIGGEGYALSFLHPYAYDVNSRLEKGETFGEDANEYSAVLWLEYNGVSALFTGDLPSAKEDIFQRQALLSSGIDLTGTDILKVSHHGAESSTSEALLALLQAKTAVISCGENAYGHPSAQVLARLQARDMEVYRTDTQGSVVVCIAQENAEYSVRVLGK